MSTRGDSVVGVGDSRLFAGIGARVASSLEENGTLVIVLSAFAIVTLVQLPAALVQDGWMALVSGRFVAHHGLPSHETLTVWAHGRRWTDQQWLAQLVLYELQRLGGIRLVMIVHAALTTAGLAGAAVVARRLGGSARSATWTAVPVLFAYWGEAGVMRTQSLAYILFVVVLWLLLDDRRRPSARVFAVLPVLVLWANLHGSVIVGAALVSGYGLVELAAMRRSLRRDRAVRFAALLTAPWLCVLASPYATSLPAYYEKVLVSSGFGSYVTEWAPTTLSLHNFAVFVLALGGLWLIGRAGGAVSTFEKLAFVGLTLLAFDAVRNGPWIALISLVVLPRLLDSLRRPAFEPRRANRLLAVAALASLVAATVAVAAKPSSWFTTGYPDAAAGAAAKAAGTTGRIFADERFSDWLLWKEPQLAGRVAFDTRFELLKPSELRSVDQVRFRAGDWRSLLHGYSVLVFEPVQETQPIAALERSKAAHVIESSHGVVVLAHAG